MTQAGKPEEKLALAFRLYDIDRNGSIEEDEMTEIIKVSSPKHHIRDNWVILAIHSKKTWSRAYMYYTITIHRNCDINFKFIFDKEMWYSFSVVISVIKLKFAVFCRKPSCPYLHRVF